MTTGLSLPNFMNDKFLIVGSGNRSCVNQTKIVSENLSWLLNVITRALVILDNGLVEVEGSVRFPDAFILSCLSASSASSFC